MTKVIITGGAGFFGFHLARNLVERGYHVDLVDNFRRAVRDADIETLLTSPHIRLIECNLLDRAVLNELDRNYNLIFHFAAILGVAIVLKQPYKVLVSNIELLANMIEFGRSQKDLKRFIFASSSEVYAGTLKYFGMPIPTPECTPLTANELAHPRTSYMLSKIYGEAMCRNSGLPFTIVRPHNIYGPRMGMSHVIPELLKRAREVPEGEKLKVYSVNHQRTFCYIDDAIELLIRIVESPACVGETLNLGSEKPEIRMDELARIVLKTIGRNLEIDPQPETTGSPPRRAPDMSRTTDLVGYRAQVDIETGVVRTYDWYRANVFEGHGISAR